MKPVLQSNVILHAFDWPYSLVTERAAQIAAIGYTSVLVSPAMKSFRAAGGTPWWQRYQPQDYRVIDNQLGNKQEFVAMIEALRRFDIWVYVDVVFNHMANESNLRSDLQYPSAKVLADYQAQPEIYTNVKLSKQAQ